LFYCYKNIYLFVVLHIVVFLLVGNTKIDGECHKILIKFNHKYKKKKQRRKKKESRNSYEKKKNLEYNTYHDNISMERNKPLEGEEMLLPEHGDKP
jgi:hypothetical protein